MKTDFMIQSMSPDLLPGIAALARVAHHASFTRAADELGVSASALSQTVRTLEGRLGVRLLERTTRRVGMTEAGRRFLAAATPALQAIDTAIDGLDEARDEASGVLRLNLSRVAAEIRLLPFLRAFGERHPRITLDLHCDNRLVDLVGGGFDAGIRLGESLASDMVAIPLGGPQRLAVFAAPAYVERHGAPDEPKALAGHACLNIRLSTGALYRWEFARRQRTFDVAVPVGPLISNDNGLLIGAARAGAGIACAMEDEVRGDFATGTLVPLLEPWWCRFPGFHLYCASRKQMPRRLRVFIDFFRAANAPPAPRRPRASGQPLQRHHVDP